MVKMAQIYKFSGFYTVYIPAFAQKTTTFSVGSCTFVRLYGKFDNPQKYTDPDGLWQIYSKLNTNSGKPNYFMTTTNTSNQATRTIGVAFPGGTYLSNMQNGLLNFFNKATATNFNIEYDSSDSNFDGFSTALDILSLTPAGQASQGFSDIGLQKFLNSITFDLFGGVEDKETAVVLGSAIVRNC
jgi:hypothetical protein